MCHGGFVGMDNAAGKILSFEVANEEKTVISMFAFAHSLMESMSEPAEPEEQLVKKATSIIKNYINEGKVIHLDEYPFEYKSQRFMLDMNAGWWTKVLKNFF